MKKYLYILIILPVMQSCFVAKDYKQPENVVDEAYFRTDMLPEDSISFAEVSWRELFSDSLLVKHIERGLENNIDIRVALQQIMVSEAYFKQGKAGFFPTLMANGQVTHQELSQNSQFGSFFNGGITQYELSGTLSWEADIWGKIRSNRRAFEASYLQTVAAHQAIKTELVANIATMYFRLIALDEQLKLTKETISNRENSLETTRALKEAGTVTEVGVKQTEAQLYTAQALLVDLELEIKLTENTLSILLGENPHAIERSSFEEVSVKESVQTGYPVQLLRNRPDVIAAEMNLRNAFELTNVAKSNFYPSLTLSATGGLQSLELDKLFSVNSLFATIVGGIAQPVINGRKIRTQYEVSLAQKEQAYLNFRQAILTASKEVSDALYTYKATEERIEIRAKELEAYSTAITYSEDLLDNGMANYLEVLTARESALNSELNLINAKVGQLNSIVELYRSLGGGWQ
ncbi:multidrug transporter [Marivirga lumbricoides]|uniref:Multidrug transporter n=1 Tax=Marivirga lumbricoides TaxID=1046115 RepID=A0ABQ1MXW6_9BACT|nr:multidrug transporter [Marivirga lumbricoides]